jgi:chaperonin cofactor prefoldin
MRGRILLGILLCAVGAQAQDLPVRQVILYKHGVGYFQRSGQLNAGQSARLDFNATEMNDVLKSLTIFERGGGRISGLRYDSSEPLEKKLAEYPFRLGAGQPLSAVLDQLKGAQIELRYGAETVRGAILGGRVIPRQENRPENEQLTLLLDSGELRNFDLGAAASIRLLDSTLQTQFQDYLAALVTSRSKDKRSVYIDSTGAQARELFADYMIPMPLWKSSYRLIWGADADPMLEGWAIIDNTTGEDWTDVRLSLVSGRPISFISQLYEPRYIARPVAELPGDPAQRPVILGGAIGEPVPPAAAPAELRAQRSRAGIAASEVMAKNMALADREEMTSTIAAQAAAQELGELFEYRFGNPVTVRRNESAMLPFLQQTLTARRLLIYLDQNSVHPMNAAELTNSTGKTLDGGPITVYESSAYAGEALMETLKAGDKRLISYGVDLGTRVTTQFDSRSDIVREVHFRRGVLTAKTAAVETKTYTIRNVDQEEKTLIIEHPVRPQYKLVGLTPKETTANSYRFEVTLTAGAEVKFPVTEERVYDNRIQVSNLTPDVLVSFVQNRDLSDVARTQLQQILDRKRQIAAAAGEIERAEQEIRSLIEDQNRLRQNINSLNRVAGQEQQVQAYSRQLAGQETQLAALRDRMAESQRRMVTLEEALNSMIERMEF